MKYKLGDIVSCLRMKLKLEKPGNDCEGCAFEHHLMKYCNLAIMTFGNFKFIKVEDEKHD